MLKKIIFIQIGVVMLLAVPFVSSAATVGNSGVGVSTVGSGSAVNVISTGPLVCFPFNRSLSVGVSGSDVTALQEYLAEQGYFNVSATGYFGTITEAAVGQWQASNGVAALGAFGNGTFGPLSRAYFSQSCSSNSGGGSGTSTSTQAFSASPQSGIAPLTVQFTSTAPQGSNIGTAINFGDGATGTLAFLPVCSSCDARAVASHTYTSAGTYTATLTSGSCSCPAGGICNCPNIQILGTLTITVNSAGTTTTTIPTAYIQQLNAPGNVTLPQGGIAEIRNENTYFTLESIASSSVTIGITPVGCWNSFPSDSAPKIVCMIAPVPIPPQTFTVGQTYSTANYMITLTQLNANAATFSVNTNN